MTRIVAVTGATGFIGWHVARRFLDNGWRVRALVRPESGRPVPDGVERVTAPLREADVISACRGATLIVHMAGAVGTRSAGEFSRSNVEAAGEVARAARGLGVRLVHMSSLGVTGPGSPGNPPTEDDPLRPINLYGESKRLREERVRAVDGLDWLIVRPTLVYGPRDRLFLPLFKLARHGLFPVLQTDARYNVIHVDDLARGVEAVAVSALSRETFFIGHPVSVSIDDILRTLASTFDQTYRPIPVPFALARLGAWLGVGGLSAEHLREVGSVGFVCNVERAERCLGFRAEIGLADGFRSSAAWYRANQWLG